MIYELAIVAHSAVNDEAVASLNALVSDVLKQFDGEILVQDDWGVKNFAQPTAKGINKGRYLYYIYKSAHGGNEELVRKLRITENVIRHLISFLGKEGEQAQLVKAYKTPYSKRYHGSITVDENSAEEEGMEEVSRDPKRFVRRRSCWFTAKKIKADWKDPGTYAWLLNEFGKISPSRVTGISQKHQKWSTAQIKRARQMCLVSNLVNRYAE